MARSRQRFWFAAMALLLGAALLGARYWAPASNDPPVAIPTPLELETSNGMVLLPGGLFMMGSVGENDHDTHPLHQVRLDAFWIDATAVTNRQFRQFVKKTQYVTDAEREGSSRVFDRTAGAWNEVEGTDWRHPETSNSSLVGREDHPVVHVSWRDAVAYAAWADKRLPTEAELEYAARGGLSDCIYPWGRELTPNDQHLANGWQGHFPEQDLKLDGYHGTSPVKQFPPNRFGLYDMVGNVWNWGADWYAADYYGASLVSAPRGPNQGSQRVRRGGSWLSAPNYGGQLNVAYRGHADPGESSNHTGFRCARDKKKP